jgi:hypothetical protein
VAIEQASRDECFRLQLLLCLIAPLVDDFLDLSPPIRDANAQWVAKTDGRLQALRRGRAEPLDLPEQPLGSLGQLLDSAARLVEVQREALKLVQIDSRR